MSGIKLIQGDCLEAMDKLIEEGVKVDAVICDPPYGTTACSWDSVIPFDEMWERLKALRKDRTPIVLFGSEPFSSHLRMSNIKEFKYDWIWDKVAIGNFVLAKKQPLKQHELISVFSKVSSNYYPQGLVRINKVCEQVGQRENLRSIKEQQYVQEFTNYPKTIQTFNRPTNGFHSTQKPVDLMQYLILTYTNQGDTVLDFTMGSGTTGVACVNTGRNFIGIELDEKYFKIAEKRIESAQEQTDWTLETLSPEK
jgi:DNA modification methylase